MAPNGATYSGQSKAIRVGGASPSATQAFATHGFRLSVTGTQVLPAAVGTALTYVQVDFAMAVADTDGYWDPNLSNEVTIPSGLCGVYSLAADGFHSAYNQSDADVRDDLQELVFVIGFVDAANGEDPALFAPDVAPNVHTHQPVNAGPLSGYYKLLENGTISLFVANRLTSPVTLKTGSFTGVLAIQTEDCSSVPTGFQAVAIADGAIHVWPLDEPGGDAIDIVNGLNITPASSGVNPVRSVPGPSQIAASKAWHMDRSDSHGTVNLIDPNNGVSFPSGNQDWTLEFWGNFITTFLDDAYLGFAWGNFHSMDWRVGGSPTYSFVDPSGVTIATTSGSPDISSVLGNGGGGWHHCVLTYVGSTQTYTLYADGNQMWTGHGSSPLIIDLPGPPGLTRVFSFSALQTFEVCYLAIYPSALSHPQVINHSLGDGAVAPPPPPVTGTWSDKPTFLSYPTTARLNYENIHTDIEVSGKSFVGNTYPNVALRFEGCTGDIYIHDCDFNANQWDAINFIHCTGNVIIEWCRFGAFAASSHGGRLYPDVMQWDNSIYTGAFRNNKIKLNGYHEDILNFYQSGGPDSSHLFEICNNAIEGGTPYSSGSGTGSLLADNTTTTGHLWVHDNTYLNPGQVGVGISQGLDCHVTDNIIYGVQTTNANVGIYTPYSGGANPGGHEVARNRVYYKNAAGSLNPFFNGGSSGPIAGISPQTNVFNDTSIDPAALIVTL